jgi:hypothetical protein
MKQFSNKATMKLIVKCLVVLTLGVALVAKAGVAADISTPVYQDIRFSKKSVALITERGAYSFDRRMMRSKLISGVLPTVFLPSTKTEKLEPIRAEPSNLDDRGDTLYITPWRTSQGVEFQTEDGYCSEGSDDYHSMLYKGKVLNTHLPGCESISDLQVVGNQLWLGAFEQYEYGDGAGSGVRVISLKSKKLMAAFSPKRKSMEGYVMPLNYDAQTGKLSLVKKAAAGRAKGGVMIAQSRGLLADGYVRFIRHDPITKDVWVLTQSALHRISNEKDISRWYLSEQFDSDGQVTLQASMKPLKSNAWAILARHTKLVDTKPIWKQIQQSPKLAKRVTYRYDELGDHFLVDGKLFNPSSGFVYNEYRFTAQEIIDKLKEK